MHHATRLSTPASTVARRDIVCLRIRRHTKSRIPPYRPPVPRVARAGGAL